MSQGTLPIVFKEMFQLIPLGIKPQSVGFATLTMQSDKYICVRNQEADDNSVVVIDVSNPSNIMKQNISGDSAIMNPEKNVIAVKSGQTVQVFDFDEKRKLGSTSIPEAVSFWKWVSATVIGIVSVKSVYHFNVADGSLKKMLDRHPALADTQIISYRTDGNFKWCTVVGISKKGDAVAGSMQLFSSERNASQSIEAHCTVFAEYDSPTGPVTLCAFASRAPSFAKLVVSQVAGTGKFAKVESDIFFPPEAAQDFPISLEYSSKYKVLYMITKFGYLHMFDVVTGSLIYMNRISVHTIFATAPQPSTGGIVGVNRQGQVLSVTVDERTIVNYISNVLKDVNLATDVAIRSGLPGADGLVQRQFMAYFQKQMYTEAAKVAANSPNGVLRNIDTIRLFQQLPTPPGQRSPLLNYFTVLLEIGKLNAVESMELARPVLQQGRKELLEAWLRDDKLESSEELGSMVYQFDAKLALSIFFRAKAHDKVVSCLADTNQIDKIIPYAEQAGATLDFRFLLNRMLNTNPGSAAQFAQGLVAAEKGPLIDLMQLYEIFMQRNLIKETTGLLLEPLKKNRDEDGALQTKVLEINLVGGAPQVAEKIIASEMFTKFDKPTIAVLCEKAGLNQLALQLYTKLNDIKRVLANAPSMNADFLLQFFGRLSVEDSLVCLRTMLSQPGEVNLQIVVSVATKYSDQLTPEALIALFDEFDSFKGLFFYLGSIINFSENQEVHYRYIDAGVRLGRMADVEKVCRESNFYDPERVRDYLKSANLTDQRPLIIVCDRFGYIEDMTQYLYKHNMGKYIEAYMQQINPMNTPAVVGALLDVDCNEDYIRTLVMSVGNLAPVGELVAQVAKRNRLKILLGWLEARVAEGNQDEELHNALAMIYVDSNTNPAQFLEGNQFYNSKVVGKYCEKRDPFLAFIAYKRGQCDLELIAVTNENSLFKHQARYLVTRQSPELWMQVLSPENEFVRQLVDQVVQTALPESRNPEEVSSTVKAFMAADLPNELIILLEKIIFEGGEFAQNKNLQNLLILTAIKAERSISDYIARLDYYDGPNMAEIALSNELYEDAFQIYVKFGITQSAMAVLADHIGDVERATEYAEQCDQPACYSALAKMLLVHNNVKDAIGAYLKAQDSEHFAEVIAAAEREELWEDLVGYLMMCRQKRREPQVDSSLVYGLARSNALAKLEEFIAGPNCAQIQVIGDRCFDEALYDAATVLFTSLGNYSRLASTLAKVGKYSSAVEAARKANSSKTWKEVNLVLLDSQEFRLAQMCALNLVVNGDELDELITEYEKRGLTTELISVLEGGLGLERAHVGLFTELALLYSKYQSEKLAEFIKVYGSRMNVPKVIRTCEKNHQWKDLAYLYELYQEFDNAVTTMMSHASTAWTHAKFKEVVARVSNVDTAYKALQFYLDHQPSLVNDLLLALRERVDPRRVVSIARKAKVLFVIKPFLVNMQDTNNKHVNKALNELYVEEEDYKALRDSIDRFDAFDSVDLAQALEGHELVEFRRISVDLYKKHGRFDKALDLAKSEKMYRDAIDSVATSGDSKLATDLLKFFAENDLPDCFTAGLYAMYPLVSPDVVLELAWRGKVMDHAMPFFIQTMFDYRRKMGVLENQVAALTGMLQGMPPQGMPPQSMPPQGMPPQGMPPQGMPPQGMPMPSMGGPNPAAYGSYNSRMM